MKRKRILLAAMRWFRLPRLMPAVFALAALSCLFLALAGCGRHTEYEGRAASGEGSLEPTGEVTVWTCAMHPQVRLPRPGKCPICFMDLIPVTSEAPSEESPRRLVMSEAGRILAEVETAPVERKFVTREVRMVGKVEYDERRLAYISAYVPGRIDRLYVDYTGISVRQGEHMVYLYSPDLVTAQQELLQARRAMQDLGASGVEIVRRTAEATLEAARERLRLWGLTPQQIQEIEERGTVVDHVTIYSPLGGIVVEKMALEGDYVNTGQRIYTIADLSQVWVKLDAYESDLQWVRYGQPIEFYAEAYPGEKFAGRVAYVDPFLNEKTRTVRVRANVPNPQRRLLPGMFVRAIVRSHVAEGGRVLEPELAGKWISPMHPEIVKDEPGACDICGMPLVPAESFGFVSPADTQPPLVIPQTAPLLTGKRAVVYVEVHNKESPTYEGREVELGPRANGYYLVRSGLQEGERVVVRGNFKIDSTLQIQAKPSMMSPEGGAPPTSHDHGVRTHSPPTREPPQEKVETILPPDAVAAVRRVLGGNLADVYQQIVVALAADNVEDAVRSAQEFARTVAAAHGSLPAGPAHGFWGEQERTLSVQAEAVSKADSLQRAREAFASLSEAYLRIIQWVGYERTTPLFRLHCPMWLGDRGAWWLQQSDRPHNPYFGAAMLSCADVVEPLPPR